MKQTNKHKIFSLILTCAMALGVFAFPLNKIFSSVANAETQEVVSLTNSDFNTNKNSNYLDSTPTGWTRQRANATGTHGIINTAEGNSAGEGFQSGVYRLIENPQTSIVDPEDTKVLMLNARKGGESELVNDFNTSSQGYRSNSFSLEPHSYYKISILAKSEIGAFGSIYLNGIDALPQNSADDIKQLSKFESFQTSNNWSAFIFLISTGTDSHNASLELWLGEKTNLNSPFAVFYDNIKITKHTQTSYLKQQEIHQHEPNLKTLDLKKHFLTSVKNADFEIADITAQEGGQRHWTPYSDNQLPFPLNSINRIVNSAQTLPVEGYNSLGSNNLSGPNALWLAGKQVIAKQFGYQSTSLDVNKFNYYKINIFAKVDTNTTAKIVLEENNDVINFLTNAGLDEESIDYTPKSATFTITSNPTSKITNNYGVYSFYVKAGSIYNTSVHLKLLLSAATESDTTISGSVLFDDITVEQISSSDYSTVSESDYIKKIDFETTSGTLSVPNGNFNLADIEKDNNTFPVNPKNWQVQQQNPTSSVSGIINLQTDHFNANANNYGIFANPGNPSGVSTDKEPNNVLMLWNKSQTHQSVKSDNIPVSANSIYTLSFKFKTTQGGSNFNVTLLNQDDVRIYKTSKVNSVSNQYQNPTNSWITFKINVKTGESTSGLKIVFALGDQNLPSTGHVFIDNVVINPSNLTDAQFLEKLSSPSLFEKTVEMSNFLLNAPYRDENNNLTITAFEHDYQNGFSSGASAGVIDGTANDMDISNHQQNTSHNRYIYYISTYDKTSYALNSNQRVNLKENTVYKFSVWVNTNLESLPNQDNQFGAAFSLIGVEGKVENISTENNWQEVLIIVNTTQSTEVGFSLAMNSPSHSQSGVAFFENFTLETLTQEKYQEYVTQFKNKENDNLLIIGSTDPKPEETEEQQTEKPDFNWLIVPSMLTAAALVLAVVGTVVKKVNIKKYTKVKKSQYDRNKTLYKDVLRKQASDERDQQLQEINQQIKQIEQQISQIEQENQQRLDEQRKNKGKQIDKTVEKQFKQYASKRTKLEQQKEALVQKAKYFNTAEYLLELQNKIHEQKLKEIK